MASKYRFPILSGEEIVQVFREVFPNLKISTNDFESEQLNVDRIQELYLTVLSFFGNCSGIQEQLNQPQLQAQYQLEYPELHEEFNYRIKFFQAMQRIMQACDVDDFGLLDIVEPKPRRTIRQLSALYNFIAFSIKRQESYDRNKEEQHALIQQQERLVQENTELEQHINNLKAAKAAQEGETKQLNNNIEQLSEEFQALQQTTSGKNKKVANLKLVISEHKAKMVDRQTNLANIKEQSSDLDGKIVQSPGRMESEQEHMEIQLEQRKSAVMERMKRLQELRAPKENRETIHVELDKLQKWRATMKSVMDQQKSVENETVAVHEQMLEAREKMEELDKNEQLLRRSISIKQEKMAKLELQLENDIACRKKEIEHTKRKLEHKHNLDVAEAEEVKRHSKQRAQLQKEVDTMATAHKNTMDQMRLRYSEVLEYVNTYHSSLGEAWETFSQRLENAQQEDEDWREARRQEHFIIKAELKYMN